MGAGWSAVHPCSITMGDDVVTRDIEFVCVGATGGIARPELALLLMVVEYQVSYFLERNTRHLQPSARGTGPFAGPTSMNGIFSVTRAVDLWCRSSKRLGTNLEACHERRISANLARSW